MHDVDHRFPKFLGHRPTYKASFKGPSPHCNSFPCSRYLILIAINNTLLLEKVKTFKYLGSLLTSQNSIRQEIKCRFKEENSCYCSVQTLRLISKNLKIKVYKTIIRLLSVVLDDCEAWSLILREECRLRVFENRILRRIFGLKKDENGGGGGEGSTVKNLIVYIVHLV
jgi:hypothetical protein